MGTSILARIFLEKIYNVDSAFSADDEEFLNLWPATLNRFSYKLHPGISSI